MPGRKWSLQKDSSQPTYIPDEVPITHQDNEEEEEKEEEEEEEFDRFSSSHDSLNTLLAAAVREENDSGIASEDDGENDDDKEEEEEEEESTTTRLSHDDNIDCFCHVLRRWLRDQGDRGRTVLDGDKFFRDNNSGDDDDDVWSGPVVDRSQCQIDPYPDIRSETFRFSGERDRRGRPNGRGRAYFPNGRKFVGHFARGIRDGPGELFDREGRRILGGTYSDDRLHGVCEVVSGNNNDDSSEMTFERGVAHGPARRFGPAGELTWLGRYRHGAPWGACWRSNDRGESWCYGSCNKSGRMSGDDVVYVYPDFHTALVGKWENDCMVEARLAGLVGVEVREGFLAPVVKVKDSQQIFRLDVSGYSVISTQPMLRDPYEEDLVECRHSALPGGGQGLFVKKAVRCGAVVSFYNGVRLHDCQAFNDWDYNSYKIRLNEKRKQILDIPPPYREISRYNATLAHKVNHSFFPNCRFADFHHPRFGRILCVKTTRELKKGEELLCNYGYNKSDCPKWFRELHDEVFKLSSSSSSLMSLSKYCSSPGQQPIIARNVAGKIQTTSHFQSLSNKMNSSNA